MSWRLTGVAGESAAEGSVPEGLQAAGSFRNSGGLAEAGVAPGAPQAQISANDTASLGSSGK